MTVLHVPCDLVHSPLQHSDVGAAENLCHSEPSYSAKRYKKSTGQISQVICLQGREAMPVPSRTVDFRRVENFRYRTYANIHDLLRGCGSIQASLLVGGGGEADVFI